MTTVEICDNCYFGNDPDAISHRCRADETSCIEGTDCEEYVEDCGCTECWCVTCAKQGNRWCECEREDTIYDEPETKYLSLL